MNEKQGTSLREAARIVGCTHPALTYAIRTGMLATFPDGSVDLDAVKRWWAGHTPNRRGRPRADGTPPRSPDPVGVGKVPEVSDDPVADLVQQRGIFADRAAAELHKATYAALAEELEYEQLAGSVVEVSEVAKVVGSEYSRLRTKLLGIPSEQCHNIHGCKTLAEVQDTLLAIITECLEELSADAQV